ncbi:SpvB/TcaC N-terminal domain-containing protein [Psychrobacter sp. GP33]|uniref:SpvB/TcaC N-terminal domain-containing protein n=1 Tax=Psychrobacter sp. GP33 TaxID=2758709 RepID=UPI0015F7A3E8|nr:SpvB/TcaC N-terminal domain-containing protein [Psychrobacter sp. GP33]
MPDFKEIPQSTAGNGGADNAQGTDQKKGFAPTISLPKGGGAIRGIGEKFAANPVTGTGSMSVPIATSPGRSGFGPQLALSYDSGSGNGVYGFGWTLSLPAITRKTAKGLPQYHNAEESDVFVLSGAEDLVPLLNSDGKSFEDKASVSGYLIHRYRPRIEGLFARIERWTRLSDEDVHWRSISQDNILTLYGKDTSSRIVDPEDPSRIFSWLICETRDDKGNAIQYGYKSEDGVGVDLTQAHERNRGDHNDPRRTANRYLKRMQYGNRTSLLDDGGSRPIFLSSAQIQNADWMFEVVLDYGEHDTDAPTPNGIKPWVFRNDPFSTYHAGFEVRTTRLCQRVLMFHHFEGEEGVGNDCLVRSTDFTYSHDQDPTSVRNPIYSFLGTFTQTGYKREGDDYKKRSLPPVEFEYTEPIVQDTVEEVDSKSLENLPIGLDGMTYQWTDLHGEGLPGILTEQANAWYYKRNISPISPRPVEFAPLERVALKPNLALASGAQFMDLAGDGEPDVVVMDGPMPGLYEHDGAEGWQSFRPFTFRLNRAMRDPNLKFIDLNGDGHADVLITEDDALVWHPSLAEKGFGPAMRVAKVLDENKGPRIVFADGTQSIYLADLSGDGLTDLVRIRNGEVCYWPNLGYGRFGAKIIMDQAPWFDHSDQFDQARIRLADIDGSGTTDIIYLHRDGIRLYFNQSGNSWSTVQVLRVFPRIDDLVNIVPVDLLGNGTACLVWSSPLSGDADRPMRYINLMGEQKPHLLIKTVNNLGAETRIQYAPSTKFYLQDKYAGRPWITRLPFPVHVVERVETYDHISRNCFATRYAYHHGYFDGEEREFRGFGMVEQFDTEELAALTTDGTLSAATNIDGVSHVPPVHTKTWFHTGAYLGREHLSDFFAGILDTHDTGEYYREPGLTDAQAKALLLPDTILPLDLTLEEEREASRSLKGAMLRQEIYAFDDTPEALHPYTVTEQNFTIHHLQSRHGNRHAVFFTHPREAISYHYERNPADPRIQHALTLEVDDFGNVLKQAAIGYGRRETIRIVNEQGQVTTVSNPGLVELNPDDRKKQTQMLVTYTENRVTNTIDAVNVFDNYRTPLPAEARSYELTGFKLQNNAPRFSLDEWTGNDFTMLLSAAQISYEQQADHSSQQKRLIEHVRTLYRKDDLTALLPLGEVELLALPGESYQLAFTPGLLAQVFRRDGHSLLTNIADVLRLGSQGSDRGGYVDMDADDHWWIPSGRVLLSPNSTDTPAQELAYARQHFFLPHRSRDPFHTSQVNTESTIVYDEYDLLMLETRDALGNCVTVGERLPSGDLDLTKPGNDYRVLQPRLVMDPNRNRAEVTFDILGLVVGTAVMGKPEENLGDSLDGFITDLTDAEIHDHIANPLADPHAILGRATTRLVYDLFAYQRSKKQAEPQSAVVYALVRETHDADLQLGEQTKIQHSFSYSDGFSREIQRKIQAEPEKINGIVGPPRWVGSGWTIFNNKGKPVRQYEPFFTDTHHFEFGVQVGVSPILFYDPVERVVATLHPNHTYEKVLFDPWQQTSWDVNDTVLSDPRVDTDISGYTAGYFSSYLTLSWETWHAQRKDGALGLQEQAVANKAAAHADTPATAFLDTLGRPFLTISRNKVVASGHDLNGTEDKYHSRVELDIEGNQRAVRDAIVQDGDDQGRIVMRYSYNMLGAVIYQVSMEAGERWILSDVAGKPIRAWDSRDHEFRTTYDALRRPVGSYLIEGAEPEILVGRTIYGESQPSAETKNLRGQVVQLFDQAGVVTNSQCDFKGNPLHNQRQLAKEYKKALDWSAAVPLETDIFNSSSKYDALNRPTQTTAPDNSIIRHIYNEANLLERVEANLRGDAVVTPFVSNIDYDAKGQRQRIDYSNGTSTSYEYDPLTFRLTHLRTRRGTESLQDLSYTYDPVGNITQIRDDAQQTIFFRNQHVEPSTEYIYDALYRLIEATGREHLGQIGGAPIPHSHNDASRVGLLQPGDGNAMGTYIERYVYDAVGNFLQMQHRGSNSAHSGWTRSYAYHEASLIEPSKQSNRLSQTATGNGNIILGTYTHDTHGNMLQMPHLPLMQWDYRDQLQATAKQVIGNGGTPETTWYVYDASGQRMRKVTERQVAPGETATRMKERIYLGAFEVYREYESNGNTLELERETLHLMDDQQRIALVETRTLGNDNSPSQLIRYQLNNHLGSASLELDEQAQIISYEEYAPYGSSTYQAVRSHTEAAKQYRYTGKERDEESGLYYYGARYYAAWLGRWVACDPKEFVDGLILFSYVRNNPIRYVDIKGHSAVPSVAIPPTGMPPAMPSPSVPTAGMAPGTQYASRFAQGLEQGLVKHSSTAAASTGAGTSTAAASTGAGITLLAAVALVAVIVLNVGIWGEVYNASKSNESEDAKLNELRDANARASADLEMSLPGIDSDAIAEPMSIEPLIQEPQTSESLALPAVGENPAMEEPKVFGNDNMELSSYRTEKKKSKGGKREADHIVPKSVNPLSEGDAPAISARKKHHRGFITTGSSNQAKEFREMLRGMIESDPNGFVNAHLLVLQIYHDEFGMEYAQASYDVLIYLDQFGIGKPLYR